MLSAMPFSPSLCRPAARTLIDAYRNARRSAAAFYFCL
jgi:DNA-directed RNA polymerase specialized sigma24 family protein